MRIACTHSWMLLPLLLGLLACGGGGGDTPSNSSATPEQNTPSGGNTTPPRTPPPRPSEMGDNLPVVDLGAGRTATVIAAGLSHTCAVLDSGDVKCWGDNDDGQLGLGDDDNRGDAGGEMGDNLLPVVLGEASPGNPYRATDVTTGWFHTCALLTTQGASPHLGHVKCWGHSPSGALGLGDRYARGDGKPVGADEMGDNLPIVDLGTSHRATAISAGLQYTCALLDGGDVKCWGSGHVGRLGQEDVKDIGDELGEMGDNLPTVDLGAGRMATAISANSSHTCARLTIQGTSPHLGHVKCWGSNVFGELGLGDEDGRGDEAGEMGDDLPVVDLGSGRTATAIAVGYNHSCVLLNGGDVKCWGYNAVGLLGLGEHDNRGDGRPTGVNEMGDNLPTVDLGAGRTATAISAGGGHTCALLNGGDVKCWGDNSSGELGLGDVAYLGSELGEMGDALLIVNLGTGRTAMAISAGNNHTCALLNGGDVKCWGDNSSGELGLGDKYDRGDGR